MTKKAVSGSAQSEMVLWPHWQMRLTARPKLPDLVRLRSVAAFGLPLALYLLTMAPTVYNLDSAEMTTAAATGGLTRSTGYPLYLLLGRLWSWLPIGDVGFRLNLFSAVGGAATVLLAERIVRRLGAGQVATVAALGLLAAAPYFWAMSLVAEVYTLHTALMALLILLLMRWADQPSAGRMAAVTLVAGLSLGHHAATALLAPGAIWYVLVKAPRAARQPKTMVAATGALLAGLSVYLYLPLLYSTKPAFNYVGRYEANGRFAPIDLTTWQGMWWLVSGKVFAGQMLAYSGRELWLETVAFGEHLWRSFVGVGIGPGLLGMVVVLRRDWRLGGMLTLMFLACAGFYIDYRVIDKATMFLPAYLVWALWLAAGSQVILDWVGQGAAAMPRRLQKLAVQGVPAVLVAAVLVAVIVTWPQVDLSDDWSSRERGEEILTSAEPGAILLGWWDTVPLVQYLQMVEGERPDVLAINRFLIGGDDMMALIDDQKELRPIYINSPPASLLQTMDAEAVGPFYRLHPR